MVQAPFPALIYSLQQPDPENVLTALNQIKNTLVGHDHRKEDAVRHGLVEPLLSIIYLGGTAEANDITAASSATQRQLRLQATIILASLVSGGAQFVLPLQRADTTTKLIHLISTEISDLDFITAALRVLRNLSRSWSSFTALRDEQVAPDQVFFTSASLQEFLTTLKRIRSVTSRELDTLVCEIIANVTQIPDGLESVSEPRVFDILFDILNHNLINFAPESRQSSFLPSTASATSLFTAIERVLNESSKWYDVGIPQLYDLLAYDWVTKFSDAPRPRSPDQWDTRSYRLTNDGQSFRPLDGLLALGWLVSAAKHSSGSTQLAILRLLASFNRYLSHNIWGRGPDSDEQDAKVRCKWLALYAVPLAVRIVQDCADPTPAAEHSKGAEADMVRRHACAVLASLIADHRELQIAAFKAGAIKHICPLLRRTFGKVTLSKPYWKPTSTDSNANEGTCTLGPKGLPDEILDVMDRRAGALKALATLADKEDDHRKAIIDSGVINCIVDSLKPFPQQMESNTSTWTEGNTVAVILAACRATQSMSRSVSLLRTSLIDAGVAAPIFDLLKHSNPELQVAATDVCTNLLLDVSPMREQLTACGVLTTLCDHAKNGLPELRHSSLWALKHSVLEAPVDQKKNTFQSLGADWIVATIVGETQMSSVDPDKVNGGVRLRSANAAGDRVDLLNPVNMELDDGDTQTNVEDQDEDGELHYDEASNTHYHSSSIRSTLVQSDVRRGQSHPWRSASHDPELQTQRDDIALQTQALDFIRNLLNGDTCAEMVTYVFQHIGQQKIIHLLTDKLSPTDQSHFTSKQTASNGNGSQVYYPTEVVKAAIHVAIHISNGGITHKESLITQRSLLQAMLPHFAHPNPDVRVMCVWMIHSLTWKESEYDTVGRRKRAHELMNMGIFKAVQDLERDPSLDVRGQVKVVLRHFAEA